MATTGCTSCGAADTVTIDGVHGRRCADCPPGFSVGHYASLVADRRDAGAYVRGALPPGPFRQDVAEDMVDVGRADVAFAYLGAYLRRETRDRFQASIDAMAVTR